MSDSVKKAFRILDLLSQSPEHLTLSEIARTMAINKATAFRYLKTMEELKLIEKRNNYYQLGMGLFKLGSKVPLAILMTEKIHPVLKQLCGELNETVNLAYFHNNEVLYLDKIESNRSLQIQTAIGNTAPLHCTALGKVILSIFPQSKIVSIVDQIQLVKKTPATITSKKELIRQIEEIRQHQYGIDDEELEEGLKCIAVPLHLSELNFYGGVSLSGPSTRFTDDLMQEYIFSLKGAVTKIKSELPSY